MRGTLASALALLCACASAPPPRTLAAADPVVTREAGQVPQPVAEEAAATPAAEGEEAAAAPAEETPAPPAPALVAGARVSDGDCEKLVEHLDSVYLSTASGTVYMPNVHPAWHRSRVRACVQGVDQKTRDCLLGSTTLDGARGCKSVFFVETMKAYHVR